MRSLPSTMRLGAAAFTTFALAACGAEAPPPDASVALDGEPIDAATIDARIDARPIDAAIDARPIDAAIDAMPPPVTNGCTAATAVDRTAVGASRTIAFPGTAYSPKCIKVKVGQTVTWSGDLSFHPLRPGLIVGGAPMGQAGNPIQPISAGLTVSTTFAVAGEFGYYCNVHWPGGMTGAVYVVP